MKNLFQAKWTDKILDECFDNLQRDRPDLKPERLARTRKLMNEAVRDCLVVGYEPLVAGLVLPDADDRHVLAAAIKAGAQVIVTTNLKDFPREALDPHGVEAQSPDEFVLHLVNLAPGTVVTTIDEQLADLRDPPYTRDQLLERLEANGLPRSVAALRGLFG